MTTREPLTYREARDYVIGLAVGLAAVSVGLLISLAASAPRKNL